MEEIFAAKALEFQASMEVSSNETIKQAVIAGMGIAFLSAHTLGAELQAGRLRVLDVAGLPVMRRWYVAHRARKRLSPIAAEFREFVINEGKATLAQAGMHTPTRNTP